MQSTRQPLSLSFSLYSTGRQAKKHNSPFFRCQLPAAAATAATVAAAAAAIATAAAATATARSELQTQLKCLFFWWQPAEQQGGAAIKREHERASLSHPGLSPAVPTCPPAYLTCHPTTQVSSRGTSTQFQPIQTIQSQSQKYELDDDQLAYLREMFHLSFGHNYTFLLPSYLSCNEHKVHINVHIDVHTLRAEPVFN